VANERRRRIIGIGGPEADMRHERRIRRLGPALTAFGMAGLIAGCGAESPVPAASTPASSLPPAAPGAFAYVVDPQASVLLAFEAHAASGELRLVEAHGLPPAWSRFPTRIAADPRGRFLYAGLANPSPGPGPTHTIRSFAVDGTTGRLLARGDAGVTFPPLSLAASEGQVHVIGGVYVTGYIGSWDVFDVDPATGALRRASPPPWRFYPSLVVVDADGPGSLVYTVAAPSTAQADQEVMFASQWRDEGTLVDVDGINLQRRTSDVALGGSISFTADESGRISSRTFDADTGQIRLLARVYAFEGGWARLALGRPTTPRLSTTAPLPGTLLAVSSGGGLRLLEVGENGELSPRGSVALPESEGVRRLAFHPSGRYLYTSGAGEGLRVFRIEPDGELRETARDPQGGGEIVLTAPPS
jgi:6-phosphogluconolactonase (cycloisomerase 2 family)